MGDLGCTGKAVLRSIDSTRRACRPRSSRIGTHSTSAPSGTLRRPCSRSTLKWSSTSPSSVVADQEAEAAGRVEPFHPAADRRHFGRRRRACARRARRNSSGGVVLVASWTLLRCTGHSNMGYASAKRQLISVAYSSANASLSTDFGPGGRSTIARARPNAVPGADHRARAPARAPCGRAAALANGPSRRRSAKRSAASDRVRLGELARRRRIRFLDAGDAQRLLDPPQRHSRGRSASATWTAQKRRRRHSPARRSVRRAPSRSAAAAPSQPRSRTLRSR